jgi:hypothetical protein
MENKKENQEWEIDDLKEELRHFQQEKERVRKIVGQIGGVPTFRTKLVNILFIVVLVVSIIISLFAGKEWRIIMIEVATIALSFKIIYLMHCQSKVNHFKLWVLSSIEWRLNEVDKRVKQISKTTKDNN